VPTATRPSDYYRTVLVAAARPSDYLAALTASEGAGHEFHGNQFTGGIGGGGETPEQAVARTDERILAARTTGEKVDSRAHPKQMAAALNQGQKMTIGPATLRTDLDKWGSGKQGPVALHNVTVTGEGNQNLFAVHATDIPREYMPVIPGDAASIKEFADMLTASGISVHEADVDPRTLTATQNQLDGAKTGGILKGVEASGGLKDTTLVVDRNGNILDGHHRWAAGAAYAMSNPGTTVHVLQCNADIHQLLYAGSQFDQFKGIVTKPFGEVAKPGAKVASAGGVAYGDWAKAPEGEEPPDKNKPYIWTKKWGWVLLATDDQDHVPRVLEFPVPPLTATPLIASGAYFAALGVEMYAPPVFKPSDYARIVFSEGAGHEFHGNQHTGGIGGGAEEKGGGRLSPIHGETVKAGVTNLDLSMRSLPQATQDKITSEMHSVLGISHDQGVQNLVNMYNASSAAERESGKVWYQDAHNTAVDIATRNGLDPQVTVGMMAALSPGSLWEVNVRSTEMVANAMGNLDRVVTAEEAQKVQDVLGRGSRPGDDTRTISAGQTWGQVFAGDPRTGAILIGRANNVQLRSYDNISKAVELGSANNPGAIDQVLTGPKVRSFFNNLSDPNNTQDVCIDKHMMRALANGEGNTAANYEHFRTLEAKESTVTGTPSYMGASLGIHPAAADIVREATAQINAANGTNLAPSQVQATIWVRQIDNFPIGTIRKILNP
jgi:hypothetical protein